MSVSLPKKSKISDPKELRPSIFNYDDYREFLKDFELYSRSNVRGFSHRRFSKRAGFSSSSVLKMLIDGKTRLSDEGAAKVAKGLSLKSSEADFFCALVWYNQAKKLDDQIKAYETLMKMRAYQRRMPLAAAQFKYYSSWYYPVIRELAGGPGLEENYERISKLVCPHISASDAKKAVEDLIALDLLKRDQGKLLQTNQVVATESEAKSHEICLFQSTMIEKSLESLRSLDSHKRDFRSATLAISEKRMGELKAWLVNTLNELVSEFEASEREHSKKIYQINLNAFPLSETIDS